MVKELNRTLLENVLVSVYNDNVTFKKRFAELANAEKNTTFSKGIQGPYPELINSHDYIEKQENIRLSSCHTLGDFCINYPIY